MNLKTAFVYGPYLVLLVTFAAFVLRCRFCVRVQALWGMVLLACFSKFLCYRHFGGDAFTPEYPESVIWVWNWAYSGAFILCILSVLTFFFRLPRRAVLLPVVAWGLAAVGVWSGVRPPVVRTRTLSFDDLPEVLDGYRIVHVSDLHVSSAARRWRTERIVQAVNACDADLVALTGDLVDGFPRERWRDVQPLMELRAKDGVYAVTGNHEAYFDVAAWMPWYERWGVRFLSNACVFPRPGLALGGVDDEKVRCPSVSAAFASATNGAFRVLLQHRPGRAQANAQIFGVRLQLSGHTHGGVMPLMSWFVARHNRGFSRGLYQLADTKPAFLNVSAGVGQWAGFPLRFFNPTEITVITLQKRSDERR